MTWIRNPAARASSAVPSTEDESRISTRSAGTDASRGVEKTGQSAAALRVGTTTAIDNVDTVFILLKRVSLARRTRWRSAIALRYHEQDAVLPVCCFDHLRYRRRSEEEDPRIVPVRHLHRL